MTDVPRSQSATSSLPVDGRTLLLLLEVSLYASVTKYENNPTTEWERSCANISTGESRYAYPLVNKRAEWWDKREGKLANIDVDYPDGPAAFACTSTFCSYPLTEPGAIAAQLDGLKRARKL